MFDSTHLIDSVVNDVSINTVVSTAQTSDGSKGDNLGALAGQGYASKHGRVNYEVKTFGFQINTNWFEQLNYILRSISGEMLSGYRVIPELMKIQRIS